MSPPTHCQDGCGRRWAAITFNPLRYLCFYCWVLRRLERDDPERAKLLRLFQVP